MRKKNIPSYFAILIGLCMLLMWIFFIVSGNVPEFEEKIWEIIYHLVAEFSTAILLIVAGLMTLRKHRLGRPMLLVSLGMLLYTVIMSAGYYAQRGTVAFVVMFSVFTVAAILAIISTIKAYCKTDEKQDKDEQSCA